MGLGINTEKPKSILAVNRYKERRKTEKAFEKWELETFLLLTDYLHLLREWEKLEEPNDERYVEALQQKDYIEYIIDEVFLEGKNVDKICFWKREKKLIDKIRAKMRCTKNE